MICLKKYNESDIIKATDETIREIVPSEIGKFGNESDLNHIEVSGVTNMSYLFQNSPFNGNISLWDVKNVQNMRSMFHSSQFNGDISKWDVGNVKNMICMFEKSQFNRDVYNWNVVSVINMTGMFFNSRFNGDISNWNVGSVTYMETIFLFSSLYRREPWWYVLLPIFGSTHLMWDSLDFRWIDIERKIIYSERLSKILRRSYNTDWDGKLPEVFDFTYQ